MNSTRRDSNQNRLLYRVMVATIVGLIAIGVEGCVPQPTTNASPLPATNIPPLSAAPSARMASAKVLYITIDSAGNLVLPVSASLRTGRSYPKHHKRKVLHKYRFTAAAGGNPACFWKDNSSVGYCWAQGEQAMFTIEANTGAILEASVPMTSYLPDGKLWLHQGHGRPYPRHARGLFDDCWFWFCWWRLDGSLECICIE
jgi:hypothetical protein